MYSGASNDFDAKVRDTVRTFHCKMQISGVTDPIEDGIFTAAINEGSTGADAYIVGSFFGPTLDVTAEPAEGIVYSGKSTAISIGLDLDDGTTEFVPMGTFIAPKASDVLRAVDLYAIHYITTAEYTLDSAYTPTITYPATASAVLTELTSKSGVAFDTSMLSATDLASEITSLYAEGQTNVTYLDAVRAVASATSSNATVKRDGSVIFVKYSDLSDDNYRIEDARLKSSSIAESMLEDLFYPGTVTFLGDPRLDSWDIVGFTDDWEEYQTLACMSLVHTYDGGLSTTVTAPSDVGEIGSLEKKVNVTAAIAEEASTVAATASTAAAQASAAAAQAVNDAAQAKSAAQSATTAATSALTSAQSASTAAAQALTDASTANAAANAAGISASIAQSAAEASLQSDYKDYGTRSFSDDDIETYCALGYNDTWIRTVGYYQGAVERGQILIIHVTKTEQDNKVADLFLRAEQTEEEGGHSVNATVIGFGDTKAHFYHDNNGAHVVSENGYRTDLDGNGMDIKDINGNVAASFKSDGMRIFKNGVEVAKFTDAEVRLLGTITGGSMYGTEIFGARGQFESGMIGGFELGYVPVVQEGSDISYAFFSPPIAESTEDSLNDCWIEVEGGLFNVRGKRSSVLQPNIVKLSSEDADTSAMSFRIRLDSQDNTQYHIWKDNNGVLLVKFHLSDGSISVLNANFNGVGIDVSYSHNYNVSIPIPIGTIGVSFECYYTLNDEKVYCDFNLAPLSYTTVGKNYIITSETSISYNYSNQDRQDYTKNAMYIGTDQAVFMYGTYDDEEEEWIEDHQLRIHENGIDVDGEPILKRKNFACGSVTAQTQGHASSAVTTHVTFDTPFDAVPHVMLTTESAAPQNISLGTQNITKNGFNLITYRTTNSNTIVHWIAMTMA